MASAPHTAEVYKEKRIPKGEVKFKDFNLKDFQKPVIEFLHNNQIAILVADPGCAKSTLALYYALTKLRKKEYERIVITKPLVVVGDDIGFLPGTVAEKVAEYLVSYEDIIDNLVGIQEREKLFREKLIVFEPVQYVRGRTFDNSLIIFDEMQGCKLHDLITFTTRMSDTSKLIMLTDPYQSDIKHSGVHDFLNIMLESKEEALLKIAGNIDIMELGEEFQMRSKLIQIIYNKYKVHLKSKEEQKQN